MKAPHHLSSESKKIYKQLTLDWDFDHSALILLKTALEAYDRLQTARKEIDQEGTAITTPTGHLKPHPSLRIEKEARQGFLMAWRMLNLNIEPPGEIGRPGGY